MGLTCFLKFEVLLIGLKALLPEIHATRFKVEMIELLGLYSKKQFESKTNNPLRNVE